MEKDEKQGKGIYRLQKFNSDLGIPLYKESKNSNGWINFGQDNLMPEYYLGLLGRSPKHNAIINTKQQLIAGNGFQKDGLSAEALTFIRNPYGEADLDEVVARAAFDFEIFGAFALEIVWNNDRQSIKFINHIPVHKVRQKIKDENDPYSDGYFICNNWRKWSNTPILFCPKFSTINRKDANQIIYCKRYSPGKEAYGEPVWMSAARWCELEYEISNFHLSAAKNGFTPGLRINIPYGVPNEDSMEREMSRLRNEFEGTNNSNAPFITFSNGSDNMITLEPIDLNASDERFVQLNSEITEGIMTGHQVTSPTLFGVMQEGTIMNKSNTISDLQQFQAQYVTPRQTFIEKVFNKIGAINGVEKIYLNRYELDYDVELTVSDLLSVLTSQLPDEQKVQVLISCGYRPEEANKLVETGAGAKPNLNPTKQSSNNKKLSFSGENELISWFASNDLGFDADEFEEGEFEEFGDYKVPAIKTTYYKYTGPNDDKTRDFCKEMLNLNKVFTEGDIQTLSNKVGYDVMEYMGSYNCRHDWSEVKGKRTKRPTNRNLDTLDKNAIKG